MKFLLSISDLVTFNEEILHRKLQPIQKIIDKCLKKIFAVSDQNRCTAISYDILILSFTKKYFQISNQFLVDILCGNKLISEIAWKAPKYRVFSGLYFLVFGLNTEI